MNKIKIYMDICCLNRPFDNQGQMKIRLETDAKLYIQSEIKEGRLDLSWSYMLDFENSENPYEDKRKAVNAWKNKASAFCKSSDTVLELGKNIARAGVAPKDALHVACALQENCEYFITTDIKLLKKKIEGIIIINPIDFIRETEV